MGEWRNWQTRMVQGHVTVRSWRFKSSFAHKRKVSKFICLREDLKPAAISEERVGSEDSEGRTAKNFSEEKFICRKILFRPPGSRARLSPVAEATGIKPRKIYLYPNIYLKTKIII